MMQETSPLLINIWDDNNCLQYPQQQTVNGNIELSSKQGLQQLEQLYTFLSKETITIKDEQDHFEVNLPLL
jgi:hypothetical protein